MEQVPPVSDEPHELGPTWDELAEMTLRAIQEGVTADEPGPVPLGEHVLLAVGVADGYASVIMMRRDCEDDMTLLYDTYFLAQDETGRWRPPGGSGASAFPEWVLHRLERGAEYRHWRESELVLLGGQWGFLGCAWVTDLTVMASRRVIEVSIAYGKREFRRPVPPNGVVTVPTLAGAVGQVAHFVAYDQAGVKIGEAEYQPVDSYICR